MSSAPLLRISVAALAALGALCVTPTSGLAQIRRVPVGVSKPTIAEPTDAPATLSAALPAPGPAPTGLAASGHGITAQITWQPISGVANYTVERWMEGNPSCCRVTSPALSTTSWSDAGLEWPGTYVYRVLANYADGRQGSATLNFVRPTPQDPPAASFKAHSSGPGNVTLSRSAQRFRVDTPVRRPPSKSRSGDHA